MASEYQLKKDMSHRVRMDLLYRLRWNILAHLHDVEIAVGPSNEERVVRLFDHSSADENLTIFGLSRVEVGSDECGQKFENSYDDEPEPDGYRPPPPLIIENQDGRAVTLGQFVTEVHKYLNEHIENVKGALSGMHTIPVDELIFFRRVWAAGTDENNISLSVCLAPKTTVDSLEQFWASRLHYARMDDQKRQGR